MITYAVMLNPLHQRVYKDAAMRMAINEFGWVMAKTGGGDSWIFALPECDCSANAASRLDATQSTFTRSSTGNHPHPSDITNPREVFIGGVLYMLFDCAEPLTTEDIRRLSRLSFTYALFEYRESSEGIPPQFIPITKNPDYLLDESLSSMLKYTGKTNELFTRLMLNLAVGAKNTVADENVGKFAILAKAGGGGSLKKERGDVNCVASSREAALAEQSHPGSADGNHPLRPPSSVIANHSLHILDPLAGKGTTLFEALIHGHHAYGVEIDAKMPAEADQYLKKYLELARFKHTSHKEKVHAATRYQITLARDKEAQRVGDTRHFEIIGGDTRQMELYYKKDFFDAIVADLPYGVQHGANKKPYGGTITRNATGLLQEALPGWHRVLKPGGVMVLAWNLFLIKREEMLDLLAQKRFTIIIKNNLDREVHKMSDFSHRVDQAIERDVVIAYKP